VSDYYLKVYGSTNVLQASTSGFIQAHQGDTSNQQFQITPNASFTTIQCLNNKFWKYFQASAEVKLVGMPPMGNVGKFRVASNGTDYEIFCKAVNNGTTPLTIAGANKFDLDPV